MESQSGRTPSSRAASWIALVLCAAVLLGRAVEHLARQPPGLRPDLLSELATARRRRVRRGGDHPVECSPRIAAPRRALRWSGLLLMVWAANGLPFDLLHLAGLMPLGVDWAGLATRTLALAAAVVLARQALARPAAPASTRAATWYGYVAFGLALPYPVLRTCWALGGELGLMWPGAAGHGFAPWLLSIPWLLAAALSLLLASTWRRMPRRLLLAAGWSATVIVAMIGPAACWSLITTSVRGDTGVEGMAIWVPCLFYSSWFLWAIAAGAATRSYQLRSAPSRMSSPTGTVRVRALRTSQKPRSWKLAASRPGDAKELCGGNPR